MNNKLNRLRTISTLLFAHVVESQEQLSQLLHQNGIDVTQATLSRDLRNLRAEKKIFQDGTQKYVIPTNSDTMKNVLGIESEVSRMSIRSVDFSGNLAVIKTRPGYANAVAYDIDDRGTEYILGTIAGDDTILVIPRDNVTREQLFDFLTGQIQ